MKAIILSILLFLTVNLPDGKAGAQNIWYVDRDANGANTGRSWADAWTSIKDSQWTDSKGINYNILQGGDSVYVSDGVYPQTSVGSYQWGNSITYSSEVWIGKAYQSGHNGVVYFVRTSNGANALKFGMRCNVKLYGFTLVDSASSPTNGMAALGESDWGDLDSLIILDNCTIYHPNSIGLGLLSTKLSVINCYFESDGSSDADVDVITMSYGRAGHTIKGNSIINNNDNVGTESHRDIVQISNIGLGEELGGIYATERLRTTIANNFIYIGGAGGTAWNAILYSSGPYCNQDFYVYNNIMVSEKNQTSMTGIWIGKGNAVPFNNYNSSLHILNNTMIVKGGGPAEGAGIIASYNHDTVIVKNNIFVVDTSTHNFLNLDGSDGFPFCYKVFDYNYYGVYSDATQAFAVDNAVNISWTNWRQAPYNDDINSTKSINTNVLFANKYGEDIEDYYTTTGRDAGVNLWDEYPFLRTDILGNERPQNGDWDIGALEFNGSQSNNVNVNGKIFLQGPFSTNLMSTTLTQSSLLPNSQPYNTPPWNYNGNESFTSGPSPTMVDWVLVELRSASNPSQVVASRAAVLKNNGFLLRTNGSEGVIFNNVDPGSYYIAIYHRNHLAIMSAAPVPLSSNSALYDFTTGMNKAYGQNPMVELVTGKYGMYATDGNADGIVNTTDRDDVWLIQNGNMGYLEGDFNMNSGVTVHDVNQLWNINNGAVTQVP